MGQNMARNNRDSKLDGDGLPLPDEVTLATLHAEALRDPPDLRDWADLCALLVWAAELDRRSVTNPTLPEGATTAEYALRAVLAFLGRSPFLLRLGGIGPLLRLHKAIIDLAEGRVSPIFKPAKHRGGSPGMGVPEVVIGLAAKAMDELMQAGAGRDDAARKVAKAVHKGGYRRVTPKTIAHWRDGCKEGLGGRVPKDALAHFREPLPSGMGDTSAPRAAALLERLKRAKALVG
jgi:hypothetical protein